MKKLLSLIALSALGVSAGSIIHTKEKDTINCFSHWKNNNLKANPFISKISAISHEITYISKGLNNDIYVSTIKGLYKSTDGINFNQIGGFNENIVFSTIVTKKEKFLL